MYYPGVLPEWGAQCIILVYSCAMPFGVEKKPDGKE